MSSTLRLLPLLVAATLLASACAKDPVEPMPSDPNATVACTPRASYCHADSDCCGTAECLPLWVSDGVNFGVCSNGAPMGLGEPCGRNADCKGTLTCSGSPGVCTNGSATFGNGAICRASVDCRSTLTCEPTGAGVKTCSDGGVLPIGSLCQDDSSCDGVLTCDNHICQ